MQLGRCGHSTKTVRHGQEPGPGPGVAGRARRPPPPTACPRALRLRPLPSAPQPRLLVLFLPNPAPASSVSPVPPPGPRTLQPGVTVLSLAPPAPLQPQVPPPGTPRFPATPNSWGLDKPAVLSPAPGTLHMPFPLPPLASVQHPPTSQDLVGRLLTTSLRGGPRVRLRP